MIAPKKISVMIVEDHHLVRSGIVAILSNEKDIEVIAEAADGYEALGKTKQHKPDIILMDINLPKLNGIETTARIKLTSVNSKIIILTQYDDEEYIKRGMQSGARGFVLKNSLAAVLIDAIHCVYNDELFFSPSISKIMVESFVKQTIEQSNKINRQLLTNREREVLQFIVEGNSNSQIAKKIFVSVRTVEFHRANIKEKLNIHDVAGLTKYAIHNKIILLSKI